MDISIDVDDYRLNVRAAVVIIHNNKILTHHDLTDDHYSIIGGRIALGETSEEAVKREVEEELGKKIVLEKYAATVENFFIAEGKIFHEYLFSYIGDFEDPQDKLLEENLKNIEGNQNLSYDWIPLNELDNYNFVPVALKEAILEGKYPVHQINIQER